MEERAAGNTCIKFLHTWRRGLGFGQEENDSFLHQEDEIGPFFFFLVIIFYFLLLLLGLLLLTTYLEDKNFQG